MKIPNIKITESQRKIIISTAMIAVIFFALIISVYVPAYNRLTEIKKELRKAEIETAELKKYTADGNKPLEEVVIALKKHSIDAAARFPGNEDIILRELPELANKSGVKITSIKPQKKAPIDEIGGIRVDLTAYDVQMLPVSFSMTATYRSLGRFFRALKTDFPVFVRVDGVFMEKTGINDTLSANTDLSIFLLSRKGQ